MDISPKMCKMARERLGLDRLRKTEADSDKINLHLCSVTDIPYDDDTFDRVFRVNCFYYWPNTDAAVKQLHRVMKPGGLMVTTLDMATLMRGKRRGFIETRDISPERYMESMKMNGLINVSMENVELNSNQQVQAISATKVS